MKPAIAAALVAALVACRTPAPRVATEESRILRVEDNLLPAVLIEGRGGGRPIAERMERLGVTRLSVAVLDEGRVAWTRAYGDATPETPFEAASLARPLTAVVALRLLAANKLPRETLALPADAQRARIEAATGQPFAAVARAELLEPLAMTATSLDGAAPRTTPGDVGRLLAELGHARGGRGGFLPKEIAAIAAGFDVAGSGAGLRLGHTGPAASLVFYPATGRGAVVMGSGARADVLAAELLRALAAEYEWPGYPGPTVKKVAAPDPGRYAAYAGRYRVAPGVVVTVAVEGERLTLGAPGGDTAELHPEGEDRFFLLDRDATFTFVRDGDRVTKLTASIDGRVIEALKEE